jgi:outer membrane protein
MITRRRRQDAREKELTDLRQKALQFNSQKFDPRQGEAVAEQNRRMGPIRDKILKAIESVAKEENVSFVFDRTNDAMLLFADAKFDITYRVIDRLKRGVTPASKGK